MSGTITSTTGAVIDYEELKKFLADLTKFQKVILSYEYQINSSVKEVSRDWQDQKFAEYKTDFDEYIKTLNDLSVELDTYKNYMLKEWLPAIEEYKKNSRN